MSRWLVLVLVMTGCLRIKELFPSDGGGSRTHAER